jgi:mersacidin/lichenicidin family type 2 lantibiotic
MSPLDIIRAWKDPEYRLSLSEAEWAQLPAHPAGFIELTDTELGAVAGGTDDSTSLNPDTASDCDTPYCETHIFYDTCGISCEEEEPQYTDAWVCD